MVQYLQSLYVLSTNPLSLQEPQEILQDVVDRACKAVGQLANVVLINQQGQPRRLANSSILNTSELVGDTVYALEAMRTNIPVFIDDTCSQENVITQGMLDAGIGAAGCLPLFLGESNRGYVGVL